MDCPSCGNANPAGKKFCGECGAPLPARCAACGAENPQRAKFCGDCGAALTAAAPPSGVAAASKPVTRTAEAVAQDVGCLEAGRIFARLADLLARGLQPPAREAITLTAFDA